MSNSWFRKAALSTFSLLLLFGSISAAAENRCESRVRNAEHNLQQAISKHGEHSRQAEKRREELERARGKLPSIGRPAALVR
jgi:hypothetical protein